MELLLKHVDNVLPDEVLLFDVPGVEEEEKDGDDEQHIDEEGQKIGVGQEGEANSLGCLLFVQFVLFLPWESFAKNCEILLLDRRLVRLSDLS